MVNLTNPFAGTINLSVAEPGNPECEPDAERVVDESGSPLD